MAKKLSLLLAAVAVLAFAVPAMASASTGLTEGGSLVKTGTEIKMVSKNWDLTTSLGILTCEEVVVYGEVTANSSSGVAGKGNGKSTTRNCFLGSNAFTVTNLTLNSLTSTSSEPESGHASLSFEEDLPGLTCKYTASAAPFTYTSEGNAITFSKATLTASPSACGSEALDGTFTLTNNETGMALKIM